MVQTEDTPQVTTLQLFNECDRCGAPGGLHAGSYNDHYCADCLIKHVLYNHADGHLRALLERVITAWVGHYKAAGLGMLEMKELTGCCIDDIVDKFIPEMFPREQL